MENEWKVYKRKDLCKNLKKICQFRQKIEQNADSDSKINVFYSMEPSGSLWVPHLKKNYIIRENPANLLGNQGARPLFHIPDEIELWGDF